MCLCIASRAEETYFGAVAIDVHRMFHHDSTALTTRASGLGWTSAGLPHIQGVHRSLRRKPVDPSSLLQKLTHTIITLTVSCMLNSTDVWFRPPQYGLYSFRAHNKAERLSPLDPGISGGVTDLHPSRGYTHPVIRAVEVSHAACKAEF